MNPVETTQERPRFSRHPVHHHDPASARLALVQERQAQDADRKRVRRRRDLFFAAGRVLMALLFVVSGLSKAIQFDSTREALRNAGFTAVTLLVSSAILIECGAGLMVLIGLKVRLTASALVAYLAAVTLLIHGDLSMDINRAFALLNVALAGGMLMLVAHGGGVFSLDRPPRTASLS
jgi:putative oxidoreductase